MPFLDKKRASRISTKLLVFQNRKVIRWLATWLTAVAEVQRPELETNRSSLNPVDAYKSNFQLFLKKENKNKHSTMHQSMTKKYKFLVLGSFFFAFLLSDKQF